MSTQYRLCGVKAGDFLEHKAQSSRVNAAMAARGNSSLPLAIQQLVPVEVPPADHLQDFPQIDSLDSGMSLSPLLRDLDWDELITFDQPLHDVHVPAMSTPIPQVRYMTALEGYDPQKEVSILKSAADLLHDDVRSIQRKWKVIWATINIKSLFCRERYWPTCHVRS